MASIIKTVLLIVIALLSACTEDQSYETVLSSTVLTPLPGEWDQRQHIQSALDALPAERTHQATLTLRGHFSLSGALVLDDYTTLDLHSASLSLAGKADENLVRNRYQDDKGNHHIQIIGGTLTGNRRIRKAKGSSCISLVKTHHVRLEDLRVRGCALDAVSLDGRGRIVRQHNISGLLLVDNLRDGLLVSWSIRDASISDIMALRNGRHGVYSDHSESTYRNIVVRNNDVDGLFIRNVFNNSYAQIKAGQNGRHGIAVQGLVDSTGSEWIALNNGRRSEMRPAADVFFSSSSELSYGISAHSVITNLLIGESQRSTKGEADYALWIQTPDVVDTAYDGLLLRDVLAKGPVKIPVKQGPQVELLPRNSH